MCLQGWTPQPCLVTCYTSEHKHHILAPDRRTLIDEKIDLGAAPGDLQKLASTLLEVDEEDVTDVTEPVAIAASDLSGEVTRPVASVATDMSKAVQQPVASTASDLSERVETSLPKSAQVTLQKLTMLTHMRQSLEENCRMQLAVLSVRIAKALARCLVALKRCLCLAARQCTSEFGPFNDPVCLHRGILGNEPSRSHNLMPQHCSSVHTSTGQSCPSLRACTSAHQHAQRARRTTKQMICSNVCSRTEQAQAVQQSSAAKLRPRSGYRAGSNRVA